MKKLMMVFTLGTMLFLGACSNLEEFLNQVNAVLSTLSGTGNYSKPLPIAKYKGVQLENYRIEIDQERGEFYEGKYKYKFTIKGVLINNYTDATVTIKSLVPVYTSDSKLYKVLEITSSAYGGSVENIETSREIYTNESIKFSNELVVTRLYLNGRLVASSNDRKATKTVPKKTTPKSTPKVENNKKEETTNQSDTRQPRAPREARTPNGQPSQQARQPRQHR